MDRNPSRRGSLPASGESPREVSSPRHVLVSGSNQYQGCWRRIEVVHLQTVRDISETCIIPPILRHFRVFPPHPVHSSSLIVPDALRDFRSWIWGAGNRVLPLHLNMSSIFVSSRFLFHVCAQQKWWNVLFFKNRNKKVLLLRNMIYLE
jgi:hypothetical protein